MDTNNEQVEVITMNAVQDEWELPKNIEFIGPEDCESCSA